MTTILIITYIILLGYIIYLLCIKKPILNKSYLPYKLKKVNDLLYIPIQIENDTKPRLFLIDTGSELSFINRNIINDKYIHHVPDQFTAEIATLGNNQNTFITQYAKPTLIIGKNWYKFRHPLYITDLQVDGILGLDWLRKHKSYLSIQYKHLYIDKKVKNNYDIRSNRKSIK